ncbi:MAG: DUF349 domain-containing protein [Paludibacteraceae bacterium]|nr:DUF349 domain-containing protein [Paludibacteraceae bacterium]
MDTLENVDPQAQTVSGEGWDNNSPINADELPEQVDVIDEAKVNSYINLSEEELVEKVKELVANPGESYLAIKSEVEAIKQSFYRIINHKKEVAKEAFVAEGNEEADFVAPENSNEQAFKDILTKYREKRQAEIQREEAVKEANLSRKKDITLRLKELIESPEDCGKKVPAFQKLQEEWKSVGQVPATEVNKTRENYQALVETFYDNLKMDNELREYDFKKNLEMKTKLCELAEKLDEEADVVAAFKKLQSLHEEWSNQGPVAKDMREAIWTRFKAASTVINKKHNEFFDKLRAAANENLEKKTAICEKIEAIKFDNLNSFKEWQDKGNAIVELQKEWKTIGFAPKKFNTSIYTRFRAACDAFFNAKAEYFKSAKAVFSDNLSKKVALCEQAEALKDSTDWKETTDKLVELQKEWKTIGPVAKKQSDAVWKRFISACDAFFDAKNKNFKDKRSAEQTNLEQKKTVIEQIQTLDVVSDPAAAAEQLRALSEQFNSIGHVPLKDKDATYKAFKLAVEEKSDALNIKLRDGGNRRNNNNHKGGNHGNADNQPKSEAQRLLKQKAALESEVVTYQNNMGFLAASKNASSLKDNIEKKIADMKSEIAKINAKLKALNEND